MKPKLLMVLIPLLTGLATARCEAQWSVNFGYSNGYHGHHHHHHHHGHGHGYYGYNWWYRPYVDYVYVAPPPATVYVPLATTTLPAATPNLPAPAISNTSGRSASAATTAVAPVRSNPLPAYQGPGITIRNPAGSGGTVAFVVDERVEMDLAPGESAPLKEKQSYSVAFDRGGDFGTSRRVLGEGAYDFVATENGWELRREPIPGAAADPVSPTVRRNPLPATTVR